MLAPRWRKVFRDLWGHRARTLLVVLSIAAGVAALGVVGATYVTVARDLPAAYNATNPAHASIFAETFDQELVRAAQSVPGVAEVAGRRAVTARLRVTTPSGATAWRDIDLFAIENFDAIPIGKFSPERGAWPPGERELLIERAALSLASAHVGDAVTIRLPNDAERELVVSGLVHDVTQPPASFVDRIYGYINDETLEWLGLSAGYNELQLRVAGNPFDREHVLEVSAAVRAKIEKSGRTVFYTAVADPGKHPFQRFIDPMAALLAFLGVLTLALSGFLVVNTISALLAQQVRHIGVMKAVGARTGQVAGLYIVLVLLLGLLAVLVAIPAGMVAARSLTHFIAQMINFDVTGFSVPTWVLALQAGAGLLAPVLAAMGPVRRGARVTVREAITSYGLSTADYGLGLVDRLLTRLHGVSRPLLLSLRNTFRRKRRLVLTLLTLGLGTTIFVSVFSVRASLLTTLDDALKYWQYDVGVTFNRPYRIDDIERQALTMPGVQHAESWGYAAVRRERPDGVQSDNIVLVAPPAATKLLQPEVLRGRWLLPEDESAVVINTDLLRDEQDVRVGHTLRLVLDGRKSEWTVVGIIRGVLSGPAVYVNYPYYAEVARLPGRASSVQVVAAAHDGPSQLELARALERQYESAGLRVNGSQSIAQQRSLTENQFNVILVFLLLMAVVLAGVGALGLAGTMSINVLERTREMGVMRAVGATGRAVRGIVIGEGVLIGVLSWVVGVILALPVSQLLSGVVGAAFLRTPLRFSFSLSGAAIWLAAVLVLASVASLLPARSASRLSVREVLAYE